MNVSLSDITGTSTGNPPAWRTPRFTSPPLAEVGVAGVELAPGVKDGDDRLALVILRPEPHLLQPRPVPERLQIVRPQPPLAAQRSGG